VHEARINDLHKMGHYYIDFKAAELRVFADQVASLDPSVKNHLSECRSTYDAQISPEAVVARDADILECLLQAKEYSDRGYESAKAFFQKAPDHLRTVTAKRLWRNMLSWDSGRWWQKVVKFDR
jgi:putative hydrolases of HD superfamily